MIKVSDYMTPIVAIASPQDTLAAIRNIMLRRRVGRVPVVDGSRLVGIVSRTDLALALRPNGPAWRRRPLEYTSVWEIMSKPVITISVNESISKAAETMLNSGVTGLPVLDDDKIVGMITTSDLTRCLKEHGDPSKKVKEHMCVEVAVAKPLHPISRVIKILVKSPSHRVIVVDAEGRPIGIVTPTDLAFVRVSAGSSKSKVVYDSEAPKRSRKIEFLGLTYAKDVMRSPIHFISEEASVVDAASLMSSAKIGGLPVLDKKKNLSGLFSKIEVLRLVKDL
ncbi:MAG: CBS domain-containing protein [Nitrososphaerales archaeon]